MLTVKRYTATWCQPCRQMAPIFEEVKRENPNTQFMEIDVDDNKNMALQEGVQSVPTIIFEKDGQQVYRFSGIRSKSFISGIINQYS